MEVLESVPLPLRLIAPSRGLAVTFCEGNGDPGEADHLQSWRGQPKPGSCSVGFNKARCNCQNHPIRSYTSGGIGAVLDQPTRTKKEMWFYLSDCKGAWALKCEIEVEGNWLDNGGFVGVREIFDRRNHPRSNRTTTLLGCSRTTELVSGHQRHETYPYT